MRPAQSVNTLDGPGVLLHPVYPGHPEKTWWILFRRFAESFEVDEIEELGVSMGAIEGETTEVHTKRDTGPRLGDDALDRCLIERRKPCLVVSKAV